MPRKRDEGKTLDKQVGLKLPGSEYDALANESAQLGLDLNNYVRMLLKTHPLRQEAERAGLDLPRYIQMLLRTHPSRQKERRKQ